MGFPKIRNAIITLLMKSLYKKTKSSPKHRNGVLSMLMEINWIKDYFESLTKICYINNKPYSMIDVEQIKGFPTSLMKTYPSSLYKFFPNTSSTDKDENGNPLNYSFEALSKNKVFLQNLKNYNDPYDTHFCVDEDVFILKRLQFYLSLCDVCYSENDTINDLIFKLATRVYEHLKQTEYNSESLYSMFVKDESNEKKTLIVQLFIKNLIIYFSSPTSKDDEHIYCHAIWFAVHEEYLSTINKDYLNYKIGCFSTDYNSILMWSHYANSHEGFCIEYDLSPNENYKDLYAGLFPVIYCDHTSDITQDMLDNYIDGITDNFVWGLYNKALLRKSTAWKYENEWRCIFPRLSKDKDFSKKFFPIKKVYLGKKMPVKERKIIIDFCNNHKPKIPYCGLTISPNKYEMQLCSVLCEKCPSYLDRLAQYKPDEINVKAEVTA